MRALVIGASGLLGQGLMAALERAGAEAAGTHHSRSVPGSVALDLSDRDAVRRVIGETRPDVIFLAVNTRGGVDHCENHPDEAAALNEHGTQHVIDAAAPGTRIVYFSTDYIFDGASGPYSEDDAPNPVSAYGRTKWAAEEMLRAQCPQSLILRTTAVFGWDRTSRNFAMQVWERLGAGKAMSVPDDQWCNPTMVDYLAEIAVRLVHMDASGTFNVVGSTRCARSELGISLARAMALDSSLIQGVPTSELGQTARRPLQGGLTTTKLTTLLGTEPWSLKESMDRFRRHWRSDTHVRVAPSSSSSEAQRLKQEILDKVQRYYELAHQRGEFVPYKSRVNYAGRVFGAEELVSLTDSALDFWLTLGPHGDRFERKMKDFFGANDFIVVNSGSTANLTAVMTLMSKQLADPLRPGDEVITPAVTFPTTLSPLVHSGLIPVFVDCEVGTYNINPSLVEAAVSKRTRAMLVPHTLGNPCDMDVLCDIAARHNLYLIEDTCDALGSKFRGKLTGTFGDLATLSFYPAHHITLGEGGGVIVNKSRFARIARSVRDWGRDCWCAAGESNSCGQRFGWTLGELPCGYDHKYTYSNLGYNFKPTDLQAAVGVVQANRIPDFVAARRRNFDRLYQGLQAYGDRLILPRLDARSEPSWFALPITVSGIDRLDLVHWLENANIETRELFGGNILKQPAYLDIAARISGSLAESDRIMRDTFFIGVYPGLTDEMIDFVLKVFADFFSRRR